MTRQTVAREGLDPERLARRGGEDYELLFTADPRVASPKRLSARLGVPVTDLGSVRRGPPEAPPGGWKHM